MGVLFILTNHELKFFSKKCGFVLFWFARGFFFYFFLAGLPLRMLNQIDSSILSHLVTAACGVLKGVEVPRLLVPNKGALLLEIVDDLQNKELPLARAELTSLCLYRGEI
jgi:hypothetical protein